MDSNLVRCYRITTDGGEKLFFTESTEDLTIGTEVYSSSQGLESRELTKKIDDSLNQNEILGFVDNVNIKEVDILSGKYNNAALEIFLHDLNNLEDERLLYKGYINEIQLLDGVFYASIVNNKTIFSRELCEVYSPICRAKFCDKRCNLQRSNYTSTALIDEKTDELNFRLNNIDVIEKPDNYYSYGEIKFLTGKNKGFSGEIKKSSLGYITLFIKFPYAIDIGDKVEITAGCDGQFSTCCDVFNNAVNFRGEHNIPRTEKVFKIY